MNENGKVQDIQGISFDAAITAYSVKKEQGQTITKLVIEAPLHPDQTRSIHLLMHTLATIVICESETARNLRIKKAPGQIEWVPEEVEAV